MHISLDQAIGRQSRLNRVGDKLLQIAGGASAAYSLRALTDNGGDSVRIRRTSDNIEVNVAFDGSGIVSGTSPITNVTETPDAGDTTKTNLGDFISEIRAVPTFIESTGNNDFTLTNASTTGFTATKGASGVGVAGVLYSLGNGDRITVKFDAVVRSGSPQFIPRRATALTGSNLVDCVAESAVAITTGSFEETFNVNTDDGGSLTFSDGDACDFDISNFEVTVHSQSATVVTWYDQSGNGNDSTQDTEAYQPKIVETGSYLGELDFDGVDDFMSFTDIDFTSGDFLVNATYAWDGTGDSYIVADSANHWIIRPFSATGFQSRAEDGTQYNISPTDHTFISGAFVTTSVFRDGNTLKLSVNGSVDDTTNDVTGETFSCDQFGARAAVAYFGDGMKEVVIYDSDQSSKLSDIETNIVNHYGLS